MENHGVADIPPDTPRTLAYGTAEKRTEYTVSNQHNGYRLDGHGLRRVYFDNQVGRIGQSLYEDGQWHTTATVPAGTAIMRFQDVGMALEAARNDAAQIGLKELSPGHSPEPPLHQQDVSAPCGMNRGFEHVCKGEIESVSI